jgi:peptidoglycan hydrolase-like protein with peptidoglycan-binding domain
MAERDRKDPDERATKAASENAQATRDEQGDTENSPAPAEEPELAETTRLEAASETRKGKARAKRPKSAPHVVGGGRQDTVSLKALVYKNPHARKSLSVHHLQRRLAELGYAEAGADRDGYWGDLTRGAVARFLADEGIPTREGVTPGTELSMAALESLFDNDDNVRLSRV